jgi:hypothetical protein
VHILPCYVSSRARVTVEVRVDGDAAAHAGDCETAKCGVVRIVRECFDNDRNDLRDRQ